MDQIEFQLNGRRIRLARQQVMEQLRGVTPEPIRTWAVEVDGRLFPVKQVIAATLAQERADITTYRSRDLLRRVGFRVIDTTAERKIETPPPSSDEHTSAHQPDRSVGELRLAALRLAVEYAATRPDVQPEEIIDVAKRFESWLAT